MSNIPWIEKYRPTNFDDIVLDDTNKTILNNILKSSFVPNLLFFGPPGTGKTTTIINFIKKYQIHNNFKGKDLIIHLNASDERGIDIIRNQINHFVNAKTLFGVGNKFVVLDEVDYMTKNAQLALKNLVCMYNENIHFCLICNYISKIEKCLQNEFIKLRFNQLPNKLIITYLEKVCISEKLMISTSVLQHIQQYFYSDIRSMINYLQSNQNNLSHILLLNDTVYNKLLHTIKNTTSFDKINMYIYNICTNYNINRKDFLKKFCYYLLNKYEKKYVLYNSIKYIFHSNNINITYIINFLVYKLKESAFNLNSAS